MLRDWHSHDEREPRRQQPGLCLRTWRRLFQVCSALAPIRGSASKSRLLLHQPHTRLVGYSFPFCNSIAV